MWSHLMYFTFTNPSERQNRMSLALPLKKIYHLFTVYRAPSRVQGRLPGSWIYNPEVHAVMPPPPQTIYKTSDKNTTPLVYLASVELLLFYRLLCRK